jgi:hypothetical protein
VRAQSVIADFVSVAEQTVIVAMDVDEAFNAGIAAFIAMFGWLAR